MKGAVDGAARKLNLSPPAVTRAINELESQLGARLLTGSYYGQTVQIWSALFASSILASGLVLAVALIERVTMRLMGARP